MFLFYTKTLVFRRDKGIGLGAFSMLGFASIYLTSMAMSGSSIADRTDIGTGLGGSLLLFGLLALLCVLFFFFAGEIYWLVLPEDS